MPEFPPNHVTYVPAKFEVATSTGFVRYAFTRKCIILPLTLRLLSLSHKNVARYPLHYVIYAFAKFEVVTSNDLGGDAFT